jgi:beta-galactosidase
MASGSAQNYEARKQGGVMKSALGYFEALSQMGLNVNFKAFDEFDFSREDYSGTTIILAHQVSMPAEYAAVLQDYVRKGGKLIVDGLTAFFDENLQNTMNTGFDYAGVFGGNISEFKLIDNLFSYEWKGYTLPSHLWKGFIRPENGKAAAGNGEPSALRNQAGKGEVLWVPSLLGMGARLSGDYLPLSKLLSEEIHNKPVPKFRSFSKDVLMKTLVSGKSYITILVSKSEKVSEVQIDFPGNKLSGNIIYANMKGSVLGTSVRISPEETMVIEWK